MTHPAQALARPFCRIAIVNRGEPAMRLIRAVRELSRSGPALTTIALYTDPDERALFVREADEAVHLGPRATDYLDAGRLERALLRARADAAWVGWGFVAERPEFADLCERLGLVFIGPSAAAMRRLGDKIASKRLAEELEVPLAPWSGGPVQSLDEALERAGAIGYPLLVKASAGGGGRGVRRVDRPADLGPALESARAEAGSAFGDPTLFMERLIEPARHVEVQVAADGRGGVWALGVRDCTIQRRHQKVIEESASIALDAGSERALKAAAARLCQAVDYRGLATVEFLLDAAGGSLSFMEVNARLQVEHPVTEAVTGVDLVKLQVRLAAGGCLEGGPPAAAGHAVEARLCAEDPDAGFAPAPGVVELLRLPGGPGIRVDTGVAEGDAIPEAFDSMIAKVVAWGRDRDEALDRLARALRETVVVVRGGGTNRAFLLRLLERPEVARGALDVGWLERAGVESSDGADGEPARIALLQAAVEAHDEELRLEQARFFGSAARGRPEAGRTVGRTVELGHGDQAYRFHVFALGPDEYRVTGEGGCADLRVERLGRFERRLVHRDRRHHVLVVSQGAAHLVEVDGAALRVRSGDAGLVRAPSPGVVVSVPVEPGERVAAGTAVAVLEAMKMESAVFTPMAGTVTRVLVSANVQVGAGTPLVQVEPGLDLEERRSPRVSLRGEDGGCDEPAGERRTAGLALLRRLMLGFDADPDEVRRTLAGDGRPAPADESVRALEDDVLTVFADVCSLSQRRPQEPGEWGEQAHSARDHFFDYLRAPDTQGRGLPATFLARLRRALAHYGVAGLERTPALDQALFRIFKAHQRVEQQLPAITAILERRIEQAGDEPADETLDELLGRIVAATERRFPAVADLAREARYRSFHRPAFERGRRAVYAEMESHLAFLAANPDAPDRWERIGRLVDCPQPMQTFLSALAQGASPDGRRLMLEVLIRRYYRIRELEDVRTLDAGGRTWGTARYPEGGGQVRVLSTLAAHRELAAVARQAAAILDRAGDPSHEIRTLPPRFRGDPGEGEEAVVDLHLWDPEGPAGADAVEPALRAGVESAGFPARTARVLVSVSGPGRQGTISRSHHFTYRRSGDRFEEDRASRGLHPMMAERLDLWRLANFRIERLPSVEDVYLFHGVARENPTDERLFALAEVRDVTAVRDETGRVVALPHLEQMFLEALAAIRGFQAHRPPGARLQWNRVMLHVWPPVELRPEEMHAIVNRLAPATEGLGMEKTVVRARLVEQATGKVRDVVLHLANTLGTGVMLMRYDTPTDRPVPAPCEPMSRLTTVTRAATLGLFAAWVVHDLEELPTMAAWTRRQARRLPWARPMSQAHVNVAIALMGVVVAAGAVAGACSGGRSGFYQAVLAGFGWHAGGHVLSAVALREYTPGLVTAPLLVAPFSLWAWRRLGAAGVPRDGRRATAWGALLTPASLLVAHTAAAILTRRGR